MNTSFSQSTVLPFVLMSFLGFVPGRESNAESTPPAIVIVHGAWGGAHHWRTVADCLEKNYGGSVYRASLTGLGARSHLASPEIRLETHVQDVVQLIEFEDLETVILIGHSYGGTVISGVADKIPERIVHRLYLDSHLLENGENFFTDDPERLERLTQRAKEDGKGYLIPVDWPNPMKDTPHPLRTLTEPIQLKNPEREKIPASYWLFTDGGRAEDDPRYKDAMRAKERGYSLKNFLWKHNPQRDVPKELCEALLAHFK